VAGRYEDADHDYAEAVALARARGVRMLELRALTDWARLPGSLDRVRDELRACTVDVEAGGPSKSLDEALVVLRSA
jgi:predicted deacylase